MVPMDGILIEQVLVNLFENAVLHGKTTSRIEIVVEDIEEQTMQEIRYLDKLIDELAKGKVMDKILRK